MDTLHKPVLLKEVLEYLNPQKGQNFIDCTLGGGGHTNAILERVVPDGKVLAIDLDKEAIKNYELRIKNQELRENLVLVNDNFVNLEKIISEHNFSSVNGIIVDFGFSSDQIEDGSKGFSFLREGPLDMRFGGRRSDVGGRMSDVGGRMSDVGGRRSDVGCQKSLTAEEIINQWSSKELETIFREYGEEWMASKIASRIIEERKKNRIKTTLQLVSIIEKVKHRRGKISPATKVFQALRIAVNNELENIKNFLPQAVNSLSSGGRLAVITFHSLEDRIVKYFFKSIALNNHTCRAGRIPFANADGVSVEKTGLIKIINKKVIKVEYQKIRENPRARSAKLRVIEKI
ncbi:MAG: 16S rRNA (cytosine(1402)-N(4))-methyltransferase RsmH [Patescibacteria group bacterium]|nr:16S rRNA (cytosine(1402)-N(4))-methyltransferase RsmH [Patescibacteria group bacterium]